MSVFLNGSRKILGKSLSFEKFKNSTSFSFETPFEVISFNTLFSYLFVITEKIRNTMEFLFLLRYVLNQTSSLKS